MLSIVEEEFLSIAEALKPFAKQKMKIEPFPWFEGHLINMDELYTELTLEKVERKLLGEETWSLQTYKDMFICNQSNPNDRKVLMKADPGMGKTTLGKKVTWDWAKGLFNDFSIIFFVSLKLVNPNDLIENAIKQQNPELEGLGVSQQKLKALLNRYSKKILLILDGLDEHGLGPNGDVLKMIRNQMLLGCPVLISSRPHSTWGIEQYFPTIVRVDGFTKEEARKFVSNFFADENKIEQIMKFRPSDSREDFPVHKCPILLSILCFLVNKKEVDLSDTKITISHLYFKMVKCLYKKYTLRKGKPYQESDLIEVMKSVGKLALRTLLSNNPLLERSEVLRIAGDFVLDYGFLAGHRDFTDPTADISVTYAHRSLEEFFGLFGFIQALADGKSIHNILGSDCERPILMVNPLVLQFCLWLLTTQFFNFPQNIYQKLVLFAAERIDFPVLDTKVVEKFYPAINIIDTLDDLKLKFLKDVLQKCQHVHVLVIRCKEDEIHNYFMEVDRVLGLLGSDFLSKLTCLSITNEYDPPSFYPDPLVISIDHATPGEFHKYLTIMLPKYNLLKRNPQVYATVKCSGSQDLSTLMTKHIKQLHLIRDFLMKHDSPSTLFVSGKLPHCPQLTQVILQFCHIDNSVPAAFMEAAQNGELPKLKRIELFNCTVSNCEWPEVPGFSFKTTGKFDLSHRSMQKLLSKLTELDVYHPSDIERVIPVRLENLTVLKVEDVRDRNFQQINNILKKGKVPNLTELDISGKIAKKVRFGKFLDEFDPHKAIKLEKLKLQYFTTSAEELEILSEKLTVIQLTELDLSLIYGLTGRLSVLFTHSFPTLNTLKLQGLNANDLQSLSRASVEGKLPQLRHLDIGGNEWHKISDLFAHSAQWNQLRTLATSDVNVLNVEPECLTSLEELILWSSRSKPPSVARRWLRLKVIEVNSEDCADLIADGVERGMIPSLTTVKCIFSYSERPFFFKLLKANIFVEPVW